MYLAYLLSYYLKNDRTKCIYKDEKKLCSVKQHPTPFSDDHRHQKGIPRPWTLTPLLNAVLSCARSQLHRCAALLTVSNTVEIQEVPVEPCTIFGIYLSVWRTVDVTPTKFVCNSAELHYYKRILQYLQTFYAQVLKCFIIHLRLYVSFLHILRLPEDDQDSSKHVVVVINCMYEGWNFNSGNYLFTTDTK